MSAILSMVPIGKGEGFLQNGLQNLLEAKRMLEG